MLLPYAQSVPSFLTATVWEEVLTAICDAATTGIAAKVAITPNAAIANEAHRDNQMT